MLVWKKEVLRIWFEKYEDNVAFVGVGNLHCEWRNFRKGDGDVFFLILWGRDYWNWMVRDKGKLITGIIRPQELFYDGLKKISG